MVLRKDKTATGQSHKYAQVVKVHTGTDGMVRSADVEYKPPGESKFWVTMHQASPQPHPNHAHGGTNF
jgi:hypothetical protein